MRQPKSACTTYSLQKNSHRYYRHLLITISGIRSNEGHPVLYVSMKLSAAVQKNSNIEREVQVNVFVVTRLKQFVLGRQFTL